MLVIQIAASVIAVCAVLVAIVAITAPIYYE